MNLVQPLILSAGLGTRMRSEIPKVLHLFDGKPMITRIVKTLSDAGFKKIVVVVGYKSEMVEEALRREFKDIDFVFVRQRMLKGSGRAVLEAMPALKNKYTLVLSGDVPLISKRTILNLIDSGIQQKVDGCVLSAVLDDPREYGRVVRDKDDFISEIVEFSELSDKHKEIREINSGIYLFRTDKLKEAVKKLKPKGPKKEYYLTDVVKHITLDKGRIKSVLVDDPLEISGPNSKEELVELERNYYYRNARRLIENGVIVKDPTRTFVSQEAEIGVDSVIYPDVYLMGETKIGKNCIIGPNVIIDNATVEDGCEIKPFSVVMWSRIRTKTVVGPFVHIRPESDIGPEAKIGNFSEIKKSRIGFKSKVPHLSYIGDTEMGDRVNIGAGTITCNYDGVAKHKTIIGDDAFVGSNTNLVAPVVVGKNTLIGAGSTITDDVPDGKLAIARARQVIKDRKTT